MVFLTSSVSALVVVCLIALAWRADAQTASDRSAAQVLSSVRQLADMSAAASSSTELTIRWSAGDAAAGPVPKPQEGSAASNVFTVVTRRQVAGVAPHERNPQLSPDQIVVVAVGASGEELGWQLVKDPRIVRAESPGPDGVLTGQTLYQPLTEFTVIVPNDVAASMLSIYKPRWNGTAFLLAPIGSVGVAP